MNPSLQIKASITIYIIASLQRNKQKIHQFITGGFFLNVEINKKTSPYREQSQNQYLFLSTSCDEHGISETEEAVAFLDGVFIGIKDEFTASKG